MLTIWDVVNEKSENKNNRKRARKIVEKLRIVHNGENLQKYGDCITSELLWDIYSEYRRSNSLCLDDYDAVQKNIVKHIVGGLDAFQNKYGQIPFDRNVCKSGWNRIISESDNYKSKYYDLSFVFEFYLINDTLWLFEGNLSGYNLDEKFVMALIVMYIICKHDDDFEPKQIGIYSLYNQEEKVLEVSDINEVTFRSVAEKYIGYSFDSSVSYEKAEGEDTDRVKELAEHFDASGNNKCIWPYSNEEEDKAKAISDYFYELFVELQNSEESFIKEVEVMQSYSTDLMKVEKSLPIALNKYVHEEAFSKATLVGSCAVYYITDIHLEWHLEDGAMSSSLQDIVSFIMPSDLKNRIKNDKGDYLVVFGGDVANTLELSTQFYTLFVDLCKKLNKKSYVPIFAVLGNHEYSEFDSIDEADSAYRKMFEDIGITLLSNEYKVVKLGNLRKDNVMVVGGTGFAKYEEYYNCEHIIGPRSLTRKEEIRQSEIFLSIYEKALNNPIMAGAPVIVLTHYPLHCWMPDYKKRMKKNCLYFNGHNHRNELYVKDGYHLYANNQVGYKENAKIVLKKVLNGTVANPFIQYGDGIYEITPDRYILFLQYCGEGVDSVSLIKRLLKKNQAKLYMIKKSGFYGFFIMDEKNGAYICYGSRCKKVSQCSDIQYFYQNFTAVVYRYMLSLLPYRDAEEKISEAVKSLGLDGTIHGAIIDLDFYNHIMLNSDGTITIYYSPYFGAVKEYDSFERYLSTTDNKKALNTYKKEKEGALKPLAIYNGVCEDKELVSVDTSEYSLYGLSRKIRNIERLFTNNVLRDWNDSFIEYKSIEQVQKIKRAVFPKKLDFSACFNERKYASRMEKAIAQLNDDITYRDGNTDLGTCLWAVAGDSKLLSSVPEKFRSPEVCMAGIIIDLFEATLFNTPSDSWKKWSDYSDEEVLDYLNLIPNKIWKTIICSDEYWEIIMCYIRKDILFISIPKEYRGTFVIRETLPDCFKYLNKSQITQEVYEEMGLYDPEIVPEEYRTSIYYANTVRLSLKNLKKIPKDHLTEEVYLAAISKNRSYFKKVPVEMINEDFIVKAIEENRRVIKEIQDDMITPRILEKIQHYG